MFTKEGYLVRHDNEVLQPWLSPQDSVEALELLTEVCETLRQIATYGAMRKDLRATLEQKARDFEDFVQRAKRGSVDPALIRALEVIAERKKMTVGQVINEGLENYVSRINRA